MASAKSMQRKTTPPEPTALERLASLEVKVNRLNGGLTHLNQEIRNLDRVVEGLVEMFGAEAVAEKVMMISNNKQEERAAGQIAALDAAVADGKLTAPQASSKTDIILVTTQKNTAGETMVPSKVALPIPGYTEEVQKLFGFIDGQLTRELTVGEVIDLGRAADAPEGAPSRGTLAVVGIYEPVVVVNVPTVMSEPAVEAEITAETAAVEA